MRIDLQDIADEASRILHADTTVEDRDFNLVAYGNQQSQVDAVRRNSILQRRSSRKIRDWFEQFGIGSSIGPVRTPADEQQGVRGRLCFPARWRGVTYGYIWALDEATDTEDPAARRVAQLAEHAGAHLAQLGRQRQTDADAVADLTATDGYAVRQTAMQVADRGLIGRQVPVTVVVVGAWGASVPDTLSPNLWALPRPILADPGPNSTTLVVPLRRIDDDGPAHEAADAVIELYRDELPTDWTGRLGAGIGETRSDIADLRSSWLQARVAARVATSASGMTAKLRWADLGVYRLLAGMADADLAELVLDPAVRRLSESDDQTLVETVSSFLDHAGNVQDTAANLHVHRQTLYYRIAKAEKVTGLDLSAGRDRTRLHLGLLLGPLLEPVDQQSRRPHGG